MKTNRKLIKDWVRKAKRTNPGVEIDAIKFLGVSFSTWRNILYVQGHCPNETTRELLAQFTGLNEKELFHTIEKEDEVA